MKSPVFSLVDGSHPAKNKTAKANNAFFIFSLPRKREFDQTGNEHPLCHR